MLRKRKENSLSEAVDLAQLVKDLHSLEIRASEVERELFHAKVRLALVILTGRDKV